MAAKRVPRFEWEFPEGSLRKELKRLLGIRSLMRVARLSIREQAVELLNETEKTVFRFDLTNFFADRESQEPFYRLCHFRPLRGYEAEATKAIEILRTIGATEISEGPLAMFFREHGTAPRRYTLRPGVRFGAGFVRAGDRSPDYSQDTRDCSRKRIGHH